MSHKYKIIKMPLEAWEKDRARVDEINKRIKEITGKSTMVKLTQFHRFRSEKPIFIYDDELVRFFTKRRARHSRRLVL